MQIDLDEPIAIHCKTHGLFYVRAGDHIGENEERIAYGCYRCDDKKKPEEKEKKEHKGPGRKNNY